MIVARKKIPLLAVGILLLTCCCCLAMLRVYHELGIRGVKQAAYRVGVEPTTMGALAEYIRGTVETGMSRSEVEQALSTIAPVKVVSRGSLSDPWSVSPNACDRLWLMLTPLPGHEWPIRACYDEQGRLAYMESYKSDGPALGIREP